MIDEKLEMDMAGFKPMYDYTQYSHDNHVNVIPEINFKRLVSDTFKVITDTLRKTYGPYGSTVLITSANTVTSTKDGHNVFEAMGFSHHYKRMVYLAIKKIIDRVNENVGDGTTSCILLAEKIFNRLNDAMATPEEKRNVLKVLNSIESFLLSSHNIGEEFVSPLNKTSFDNLIKVAGNYDDELTSALNIAFAPTFDENDNVVSIRNVVTDVVVDNMGESNDMYTVDYLPGKYRIRMNMGVEFGLSLANPTTVKIALYDHAFNSSSWKGFMENYDKTDDQITIIIARTFAASFMDSEYVRYLKNMALVKEPVRIILCEIKGSFVQNEIADLAALLRTEAIGLKNTLSIDHSEFPVVTVSVHEGNALCFHDVTPPMEYVSILEKEMKKDLSKSFVKKKNYLNRIESLKLNSRDTLVTVNATSSLEGKMLSDKIDDCVAIINSSLIHGVVPNMFQYVHAILNNAQCMCMHDELDDDNPFIKLTNQVPHTYITSICNDICGAIEGLFSDIWSSKYGDTADGLLESVLADNLYPINRISYDKSYDIINDEVVQKEILPTSRQYDLEVVAASISIVKYLLTSNALVFDATIMRPTDDVGYYVK